MTLEKIMQHIEPLCSTQSVAVIGLDGLGGAGKSTLADQLCAQLQAKGRTVLLLHIDDFIHPRSVRYNDNHPEWLCYYDLQWRFDYFAGVIRQIRTSREPSISIELYDKANDTYTPHRYALSDSIVVLVEGIFLQRAEYSGLFDCLIYMDVPEELRLRRVLKRDTYIGSEDQIAAKYISRYFPAERQYLQEYQPQLRADFVLAATE